MEFPQANSVKCNVHSLYQNYGNEGINAMQIIKRFLMDDAGATAIEYGLIAAGISVAIITVVSSLGSSLNTTFTSVATALK
jgi:pilus assembly protein Flp/PilA